MRLRSSLFSAGATIAMLVLLIQIWPLAAQPTARAAGSVNIYIPLVTTSHTSLGISSAVQRVVDLTNAERARYGCPALTISSKLSAAAQRHSADMAINNRFSHTGSDGSTPATRIQQAGYQFSWMAENIAAGYDTADAVVAAWIASSGHHHNIVNCNLREIGIGFYDQPNDQANVRNDDGSVGGPYRYYWTQDFGTSQ